MTIKTVQEKTFLVMINFPIVYLELLQARYEYIFRTKILDFYNGIQIEL